MSKSAPLTKQAKKLLKESRKRRKNGRGKQWQQIDN